MTGVTAGQAERDALESIVTAWRQEAEPRPGDTQGQLISRHALGACADELARFLASSSAPAAAAQQPQAAPGTCPASSTQAATDGESHTDTCDHPEGHAGDHRCPGCGASWVMLSEHLLRKERPAVGTAWRLLDEARSTLGRVRAIAEVTAKSEAGRLPESPKGTLARQILEEMDPQ